MPAASFGPSWQAVFAEWAATRTSMDDIATAAGVGRMTVFRRFESKDRLVQFVMFRVVERMAARVRETFLGEPDLETALTEAIVASVDELRGVPLFTKVLRTEPDALLRTLTTDGGSVIAIVRNSTMSW